MLRPEEVLSVAERGMDEGGLFVYDLTGMSETARSLMAADMPYGLTVRYAAKANSHPDIINRFDQEGLLFDASSVGEALDLVRFKDVDPSKISLSSKVLRDTPTLRELLVRGVQPVATKLRQISMLADIGQELGFDTISIRPNPGEGSGANNMTTVGGPAAPFGIWKDYVPEALDLAGRGGVKIDRIHTHIGSGVDPTVWRRTILNSLAIVEQCPDVTTLDIGGGYKIARMEGKESTDMDEVMGVFAEELEAFAGRTGREIHLEVEPGTLLVGNEGVAFGQVEEIEDTPMYTHMTVNVGMNALLRISHYGAQHPIAVHSDSGETVEYVVSGPCCESGDLLTPAPGNPEEIAPRRLRKAEVGDIVSVGGVGAYCMSMSPIQYNSVPSPEEIAVETPVD